MDFNVVVGYFEELLVIGFSSRFKIKFSYLYLLNLLRGFYRVYLGGNFCAGLPPPLG